uniref:Ovule protein n=1 Tax=Caenorhabditis tropicalis TaxID=1561998 RepID=A0A1I7T628_9PELO
MKMHIPNIIAYTDMVIHRKIIHKASALLFSLCRPPIKSAFLKSLPKKKKKGHQVFISILFFFFFRTQITITDVSSVRIYFS